MHPQRKITKGAATRVIVILRRMTPNIRWTSSYVDISITRFVGKTTSKMKSEKGLQASFQNVSRWIATLWFLIASTRSICRTRNKKKMESIIGKSTNNGIANSLLTLVHFSDGVQIRDVTRLYTKMISRQPRSYTAHVAMDSVSLASKRITLHQIVSKCKNGSKKKKTTPKTWNGWKNLRSRVPILNVTLVLRKTPAAITWPVSNANTNFAGYVWLMIGTINIPKVHRAVNYTVIRLPIISQPTWKSCTKIHKVPPSGMILYTKSTTMNKTTRKLMKREWRS